MAVVRKENIDASGGFDKGKDNILMEDYIPEKHSQGKAIIVGAVIIGVVLLAVVMRYML